MIVEYVYMWNVGAIAFLEKLRIIIMANSQTGEGSDASKHDERTE